MAKTKRRVVRWIIRVFAIVCVVLAVSLTLVTVSGFLLLRNVASRITVDPQAVSDVVHGAVVTVLRDGEDDQRVEMLNQLAAMGPTVSGFLPSIEQCADDPNPSVSMAALEALASIAP